MAIQGVLFDVGGVLIRTPFEMIDAHPDIDVDWRGPFAPATDDLFADVAAGLITEREYWHQRSNAVADLLGLPDGSAALRTVFKAEEDKVIRAEMIELAEELEAAGLITGILTNDLGKFHGGDWRDDLPSLLRFAVRVDMSHTDALKPHPDAYRLGTAAMGLDPQEVLFIDDQPVNVQGALDAGLHAVLFDVTDVAASIAAVRTAAGLA